MEKLSVSDFKSYQFLSKLKFSPDGKRSALIASRANKENGYGSCLWVRSPDRGMLRLAETGLDKSFIWEDNDTLLFGALRNPSHQKARENGEELSCFYRISVSGGEAEEAFHIGLKVEGIEKIRDGLYLIRAVYDTRRPDLSGMNDFEREKALEELKKEKDYQIIDELPYWSNGRGFINGLRGRLYLYDSRSNKLTPITAPTEEITSAKISPCKKYIAYTLKKFDHALKKQAALFEYDLEADTSRLLLDDIYDIGEFDYWKNKLVFTGTRGERYGLNQNRSFYLLDRESGREALLAEYDGTVGAPVGSDSRLGGGIVFKVFGDFVYFVSTRGFHCDLYRMSLGDGSIARITSGGGSYDFFDICVGGVQAVAFLDIRLQELYAIEDGHHSRLSAFNDAIHREKSRSVPQHHVFTDPDGFELDGWALLPVDYDAAEKYPAILNIHGGPKSLFGDIYLHEMQYWANCGYIVLFCNPRGSDGKGNDFANVRGAYGTFDYENIMLFVDEMIKKYPSIDTCRMGVTGGSYGGFMTNWIIGHTDRFRAAVSQRSIANWITLNCLSDIGYYFGPDQLQADVWSDVEKMWSRSPLKYADRVKTPTLFVHSDEDYRCWVAEAYQMYTALKLHGVETRMCVVHGENHELSRSDKPEHRQKRLEEITRWMDCHLK